MENEQEFDTQSDSEDLELELDNGDDVEELKSKLATLSAQKEHWRKKAQEKDKVKETVESTKPEVKEEKKDATLSQLDILALAKADVDESDLDLVIKWSQVNNISVREALADKTLKTVLSEKKEERATANATQTKGATTSAKVTPESILEKASQGQFPERDEDIEKLIAAKEAQKRAHLK